ncbi:MAG: transposase, partial [Gammaproteobacteria bacterium]|nr:transposase [Gammaproteobacteria bacterium]
MSDDYTGYSRMDSFVGDHSVINHSKEWVNGEIHTNTIEGFWALLKRAHYGQHHHYTKKYAPLYIGESCYKYNNRKQINRKQSEVVFNRLVGDMLCTAS